MANVFVQLKIKKRQDSLFCFAIGIWEPSFHYPGV